MAVMCSTKVMERFGIAPLAVLTERPRKPTVVSRGENFMNMKRGKKYLIQFIHSLSYLVSGERADIFEVKCLDMTQNRYKLKNVISGYTFWELKGNIKIIERL